MKKTLYIIALLVTNILFSQKGKINYNASVNASYFAHLKNKKNANLELLTRAEKENKDVECILLFNKNKSLFKRVSKMRVPGVKMNLTSVYVGKSDYYYDTAKKTTLQKDDVTGETFLIIKNKIDWHFTNETKKINGFECKKAIAVKRFTNINGKIEHKIIAWYTPQIPLDFGPKNYNGLPGLILVLQEGALVFTVTKINLTSSEDIKITLPKKGKKMTQKEYDKIPWNY